MSNSKRRPKRRTKGMPFRKGGIVFQTKPTSHTRNLPVRLYQQTWNEHVIPPNHHPEMVGRELEVKSAVETPFFHCSSDKDLDVELYYGQAASDNITIRVAVKFNSSWDYGIIVSAARSD